MKTSRELSRMIKAIACDLDDTLTPEIEFVKSGFSACASILEKSCGISRDKAYEAFWRAFKVSSKRVFDRALEKLGLADLNLQKKLVETYRYHKPNISFYPDVLEFLIGAKALNLPLAIITDGDAKTQKNKIKALGAESLFRDIIATGDYGPDFCKPSPKPFELLISRFNIAPSELLYIGDNPLKDFYIGAILPVKTARIVRPGSVYEAAEYRGGVREDFTISALPEIFGALRNFEK